MSVSSRRFLPSVVTVTALTCGAGAALRAQDTTKRVPLFERETPLVVTFTADLDALRGDKRESPWRSAVIEYERPDSVPLGIRLRVKTHGVWRLAHCGFPPLRLDFSGKTTKGTLFQGVKKPKLTSACRNTDDYEQLVLQELQLYRIYQLLTPKSHRARLIRTTYVDSASGKVDATRYAFLLEDPDQMAERLGGKIIKERGARAGDFEPDALAVAFLFEYMIGNTDFSFNQLHNAEIVTLPDGRTYPIAYDFDFSGAVNAPYATPDPSVRIRRVRDRKFRGYCALLAEYPRHLALFQERKDAIYALYRDEIGRLMDPRIVRETLSYFDDFYRTIGNPRETEALLGDCLGPR